MTVMRTPVRFTHGYTHVYTHGYTWVYPWVLLWSCVWRWRPREGYNQKATAWLKGISASSFFPFFVVRRVSQEDEVLLEHALQRGTRRWGELDASGRLPRRDNKSCCNRFLFLKK